eukprot:TRINITY_DN2089_c0_g2_i5.p1 TRINITY_DN2089_c0_g2~~TRINITY_DN2089_c0_g2_i5.p1  ORF type:complete len:666 (-),score=55.30 TRINITY_DN2089_c0_g2_i5:1573-3570(-)
MIRSHLMGTTALFFLFHTLLVAQGVLSQNCTEGCVDIQFKNTSCALQKEAGLCETPVLGAKFCPCTCNLCNYPEIVSESVEELKIAKVDEQYDLVEVESSPEPKSSVVDTLKDEVATITPAAAPTVSAPTTTTPTAAAPTLAAPTKAKSGVKCGSGQPNLLVIMTDDQGHDDISFYNKNGILHTPNMDKLAAQSVQFENFYTDSLCAPTRASLLTGRHHLKTGVWGVHGAMDYINLDETIIAEVLRDAGYDTAHFGKWHSGTTPGYNPWDRGFDLSYTTKLYTFFNTVVKKNGQEMETSGWIEDWLADKIIEYMRKKVKGDKPFFILWTPMSIHKGRKYDSEWYEDFIAPGQYYERYAGKVTRDLNHVFAALEYFDTVLGRVLNELHNLEIASETVVMFFGDNGPLLFDTDHQNGGPRHQRVPSDMKEQKGFIEENGIRNFLFVRGSGRYPAGKKVYQNVGVIDIYPTLLDITGVPVPKYNKPLDGVSFGPLLCEDGQWAHSERTLYFHETLKNTLGTDQILDLNANRQTDRYQKMLSYWEGGEWGAGFKYNSGLRHKQYKVHIMQARIHQHITRPIAMERLYNFQIQAIIKQIKIQRLVRFHVYLLVWLKVTVLTVCIRLMKVMQFTIPFQKMVISINQVRKQMEIGLHLAFQKHPVQCKVQKQ